MTELLKIENRMEAIRIKSSDPGVKHRDYRRKNRWACWR